MPEKVIATQYYPSDLSHFLKIGEILDMKVEDNGRGVKVLRIVSKPTDDEFDEPEYQTVRASKKLPAKQSRRELPERASKSDSKPKRGIIGGALTAMFGDDYRNQKPPWM